MIVRLTLIDCFNDLDILNSLTEKEIEMKFNFDLDYVSRVALKAIEDTVFCGEDPTFDWEWSSQNYFALIPPRISKEQWNLNVITVSLKYGSMRLYFSGEALDKVLGFVDAHLTDEAYVIRPHEFSDSPVIGFTLTMGHPCKLCEGLGITTRKLLEAKGILLAESKENIDKIRRQ